MLADRAGRALPQREPALDAATLPRPPNRRHLDLPGGSGPLTTLPGLPYRGGHLPALAKATDTPDPPAGTVEPEADFRADRLPGPRA